MHQTELVLGGYFGFGNAGDEMIARVVRGVASSRRWRTLGVDASRWNPLSLLPLFRRSAALVYGGGELFQSRTSFRSLLYYACLPVLARACGARFVAYGMGLDPKLSGMALSLSVNALNRADRVWFRDEESLSLFRRAGGRAEASVAPDPVWAWDAPQPPAPSRDLRRILWIPRFPLHRKRLEELASRAGGTPGFLLLHPLIDRREFAGLPGVERWRDPEDLLSLIGNYDAVVSMRYHGLVLGALAGRPVVALAAHGKVAGLAKELGCPVLGLDASAVQVSRALSVGGRSADMRVAARKGLDELRGYLEGL
jgi:polysaccharide pyruvyl transferase CsaB